MERVRICNLNNSNSMAEVPKEEEIKFFVKIGWYIFGIMLGLGAKLVVVNKDKPLTMKEFVYHSAIAFASLKLSAQ